MTYAEANAKLGDADCVASGEPATRIRRESPRCIALYYNGLPILKWLDNGEVIIHNRGSAPTDAFRARIRLYCPIILDVWRHSGVMFSVALPHSISGGAIVRVRNGIRINPNTNSHQFIV